MDKSFALKKLWLFSSVLIALQLGGCFVLATPPDRFPSLNERKIAGPGRYGLIQWSPDGERLAYVDEKTSDIVIFDVASGKHETIVKMTSGSYFVWMPDDKIAYLTFTPGGQPLTFDLRIVDVRTKEDNLLATSLLNVGNFQWRTSERDLLVVMRNEEDRFLGSDVYLMDFEIGKKELLISSSELGFEFISKISLSPDKKILALTGIRHRDGSSGKLLTYSLVDHEVLEEIVVREIFPINGSSYPQPTQGDDLNFGWIAGNRWILDTMNTPEGECYNYALMFIDTKEIDASFCLPSAEGPFFAPTISPKLDHLAYVTVVGPAENYLMLSDVPAEFLEKLESNR